MLNGKVIIVTGAARGIGQAYVRAIVAGGGKAVAADLASCDETLALVDAPDSVMACELDVTSAESARNMAASVMEKFGRIDGLVNNAAFYAGLHGGRFEKIDEEEWDLAMNVNVKGIWNCCRAVTTAMRESGGGSIVNVSSLAALCGTPYVLHYTTSKAAVIGLTRGLARELGRDDIRVNAIAPSAVLTDATRQFFGEKFEIAAKATAEGQAIQRNLEPEDVTGTVMWLLSNASAFVTGQVVPVDGGTVMV